MKKLLLILVTSFTSLFSYDLGLRLNLENPVQSQPPEIFFGPLDCGDYNNSELNSISFGFINRNRIYKNFGFNLSLGYQSLKGNYSRTDAFNSRADIDFTVVEVTTETYVNFDINQFIIGGGFSYMLDSILLGGVRFDLGMNYAISTDGVFDQEEIILSPDNAVFTNFGDAQKRDIQVGNLQTLQSQVLLDTRVTNFIKLGKIFNVTQSIGFSYSLNSLFSDADNKYYSVNYEVGISLNKRKKEVPKEDTPNPKKEPKQTEEIEIAKEEPKIKEEPILPKKEKIKPEASLKVVSKWEDSELITGQELLASLPLVNSLFFESNSNDIKGQVYDSKKSNYLFGDAVETHRYLLLRISEIIKQKPDSEIELIGYTSGEENESGGIELAESRAESVKSKLVELGIEEDRISTKAKLMPDNGSNVNIKKGIEENQRVDIILKNAPTQEYVSYNRFSELKGEIEAEVDFLNISNVKLVNSLINNEYTLSQPRTLVIPINKRFTEEKSKVVSETKVLFGDSSIVHKEIIDLDNFSKVNINYDLSQFEAIIRFDYNSSSLSTANKELLKQLIEVLPKNSEIKILGSTDATGSIQANRKLEEDRANSTMQYILSLESDKNFEISTGRSKEKFPEDTPQGRFLNRSIRIKVEAKK